AGVGSGRTIRCRLALTPGVQGVVDEAAALQQGLVVVFDGQAALADGQQTGAERVGLKVAGDVGRVHDAGQPHQGSVAVEVVFVDEDLEGAPFSVGGSAVGVGGAVGVKGVCAFAGGD